MNQSRRSFLGLLSAVSAAVAAGVRVPASTEAAAAETAPVKDRIKLVVSVEASNLERDLRKLLEAYVVVETEETHDFCAPTSWRVVYRKANGATSPLDAQKHNWDRLRPTAIKLTRSKRTVEVTWA